MTILRTVLGGLVSLGALACQPSAPGSAPELTARLAATEQRLDAIEGKLDRLQTTLDQSATAMKGLMKPPQDIPSDGTPAQPPDAGAPPRSALMDGADQAIECSGLDTSAIKCRIDQAFIDRIVDEPPLLSKQARLVPSIQGGKHLGFKVYGIRPGSLPDTLGIDSGDLLTTVNGDALDSLETTMKLFESLRTVKHFGIDIERGESKVRLEIDIVE